HETRLEARELVRQRGDQVEPFLIDHSRHHADQRPPQALVSRGHPALAEHGALRRSFSRQIVHAEWLWKKTVPFRIPLPCVDAVQDADDVRGPAAENAIETEAELRRLDLLRVAAADGGDRIGMDDGALHETDAAPVLETIDREQIG